MRPILALLLSLVILPAFSEEIAVNIKGVERGKSYVLTVSADGTVTVNPLLTVTVGGSPETPPNPPPLTKFSKDVQAITAAALSSGATKTSGAAIASIYSLASVEVAEGRLDPLKAFEFTSAATQTVLNQQPDAAKWTTFRAELGKLLPPKGSDLLATKEQVASVMRQVALGMDAATGFNSAPRSLKTLDRASILDGFDIARIIELIKLVMALLELFKGG